MKRYYLTIASIILSVVCYAQGEENIWMFGRASALDFTATVAVAGSMPNSGGAPPAWEYMHSGAVCDAAGKLLFWIKLQNNTNPNGPNIINAFTASGQPMPNGNMLSHIKGEGVPVIMQHPGNKQQYYVFYIKNAGLHYSLVDLSLNGGHGDIISTQKNILVGTYGSLIEQKMTAVKGCSSTWLIVRSRNTNDFFSYEISSGGLNTSPHISSCGLLPQSWYGGLNHYSGVIKASVDGKKMAAACVIGIRGSNFYDRGGLELYDVRSCDGTIHNPIVLDTGAYFGVCFSPDGSKLYATRTFDRKLYQFDLSLPTTAAIIASRTLILTNSSYNTVFPQRYMLGDLKRGRDGKIYLSNNVCDNVPSANAVHVIQQPNLAGIACGPILNAISVGNASVCTGLFLPADIVVPSYQQSMTQSFQNVYACFRDSTVIAAPAGNSCYNWNNGSVEPMRKIKQPGLYVVRYTEPNCTLHTDSFQVFFPEVPLTSSLSYACPGDKKTTLKLSATDTSAYQYTWTDPTGDIVRTTTSSVGDSLTSADTGTYSIHIRHHSGCDTVLRIRVQPLPLPEASFNLDEDVCAGEITQFKKTSNAPSWKWFFGTDSSTLEVPSHMFQFAGTYPVKLQVRNLEGCTDSLTQYTRVHQLKLELGTDQDLADRGTAIHLQTNANEGFHVRSWLPQPLFADQQAKFQLFVLDTSRNIIVYAQSTDGCKDSASVFIEVSPLTGMPNAFSPNGDGLNDLFRPLVYGSVLVRFFEIYNRWGVCVHKEHGRNIRGWDGNNQGKPAELGTYYYIIEMEGPEASTIRYKGDVILIR